MESTTSYWYLKHFNIFDGLDDETVAYVDQHSAMCTFLKNEPIFFPSDPRKYIFFLKKGLVKVTRYAEDGREVILDLIGPGEVFGQLTTPESTHTTSFLGATTHNGLSESAVALDDVMLCNIYRGDFDKILIKYPQLNYSLTRLVGFRLKKLEQRVTDLVFKDVSERIVTFLLGFADQFGTIQHGQISLKPSLSHQDIGRLTGASRQTVTEILNMLRDVGEIHFDRKVITLLQPDALRRRLNSANR
jgi:CRP/FNR family transcriptional regulator, cyclic AMP receptor protein